MSQLITLTARQYAQLRGVSNQAVRNAARHNWAMVGVEKHEQLGGRTWIFYCNPKWVSKRREVLGIK